MKPHFVWDWKYKFWRRRDGATGFYWAGDHWAYAWLETGFSSTRSVYDPVVDAKVSDFEQLHE